MRLGMYSMQMHVSFRLQVNKIFRINFEELYISGYVHQHSNGHNVFAQLFHSFQFFNIFSTNSLAFVWHFASVYNYFALGLANGIITLIHNRKVYSNIPASHRITSQCAPVSMAFHSLFLVGKKLFHSIQQTKYVLGGVCPFRWLEWNLLLLLFSETNNTITEYSGRKLFQLRENDSMKRWNDAKDCRTKKKIHKIYRCGTTNWEQQHTNYNSNEIVLSSAVFWCSFALISSK